MLGIAYKEEVTALASKNAGHGFCQDIVFFVDGLPPTSTDPLDGGAADSAVQPLFTGGAASDKWPTERGGRGSSPWPEIGWTYFLYPLCANAVTLSTKWQGFSWCRRQR